MNIDIIFIALILFTVIYNAYLTKVERAKDKELIEKAMDGLHSLPLFQNIIRTQKELLELSKTYHEMLKLLQQETHLLKDELKKKGVKQ